MPPRGQLYRRRRSHRARLGRGTWKAGSRRPSSDSLLSRPTWTRRPWTPWRLSWIWTQVGSWWVDDGDVDEGGDDDDDYSAIQLRCSGPWFNIKMSSYQYREYHCGDKTVVRSSYLHNGISYTGKTYILNQAPGNLVFFVFSSIGSVVAGARLLAPPLTLCPHDW